MSIPLVIVGAGGFGREAVDVVRAQNKAVESCVYDLLGIVDSSPTSVSLARLSAMGVEYLGTEQEWLESGVRAHYLIGIGDPKVRKRLSSLFDSYGYEGARAIHPSAVIGSLSAIAEGAVICGGVQISTNVALGRHVHLNPNATIGHDTEIHDFCSVNPGAVISGNVRCESEVLVGAGAVILQGLSIGHGSTVGAAACVTKNVRPASIVKGIPAR